MKYRDRARTMRPDSSVFVPLVVLFVTSMNGSTVGEAFASALREFITPGPGLLMWAEILALNLLLFFFMAPIFRVHINCLHSCEPSGPLVDRAMLHLNKLPYWTVVASILVFVAGSLLRHLLTPGDSQDPITRPGNLGELPFQLADAAVSGYFVGVILSLQFEHRLYEARMTIVNLGPSIRIARRTHFSRILSIIVAIVLFLTASAFAFAGSFLSGWLQMGPPMQMNPPPQIFSAPDFLFHIRQYSGLRNALYVFGVKLALMAGVFGQMIWLLRSIIERPLATIGERLVSLNAPGRKTARVIDILQDDEYTPLYREINALIAKQEGQLAVSRKRLEDVVKLAADPILAFDSDGRLRVFNAAAESVFGCGRAVALEKKIGDFLDRGFEGFVESHREGVARLSWKGVDGAPMVFESHISRGEGDAWTTVILHDVRKQEEIEANLRRARSEAENASRMKSEFLANMSHELRTPLNAILGFTQLLGDDRNLTENQREKVRVITRSGEHLLSLINDILDISKIEAGRMELHESVFDLGQFIYDIRDMFEQRCRKKGLSLYVETLDGLPKYVRGDLGKLRQVMINLVGNSVKFTEEGGIGLLVGPSSADEADGADEAAEGYESGEGVRFAVRDTGRGIPAAELDLIMRPFVQASTTDHEGGTGLGLAISSRFVGMMGGTLQVRSELGVGSEFSFSLALAESGEAPAADPDADLSISVDPEARLRILVVDDQESNRLVLREMLERIGFQVDEAEDGKSAYERALGTNYAIVFMDIKMPIMDGYKSVALFKANDVTKAVPVFALTASAFSHDERRIAEAGFDGFLAKPFKQSALHAIIRDKGGVAVRVEARSVAIELPDSREAGEPGAADWEAIGADRRAAIEDAAGINDFASVGALAAGIAGQAPRLSAALARAASAYDDGALAELITKLTKEAGDGR